MSDTDIFFRDCYRYQKFIDDELTPIQSWKVIEWKTGTQDYLLDSDCMKFVKTILRKKCKNSESFLIKEHDEIIDIIKDYGKNNFITNIDFHHDITYGNDDSDLNIENWVQFAREKDYIKNYLWICQDNSEICRLSPFNYTRSTWKDISIDNLPEYDLVVFCISHQFTPPKYWGVAQQLREYLHNEIKNEFVLCKEPKFNENLYPYYVGKDNDGVVEKSAWYKYFGYYINGELIDGTVWLSIINLDNKAKNILSPSKKIVEGILKYYNVGFTWHKKYKTENYIRRLTKHLNIKKEYEDDTHKYIVLKNKED